jgi:hypothetical protein
VPCAAVGGSGMPAQAAAPASRPSPPDGTLSQPVLASLQPAPIDALMLVIIGLGFAGALATGRRRGPHLLVVGISLVLPTS